MNLKDIDSSKSSGILCVALIVFISSISFSQRPVPAKPQTKRILLMNGIAHLGNGKVIPNSVIGFKDGKFTLVADATVIRIDMTQFDTVINIAGKHVYPGFIAVNSMLGLTEVGAVRATHDAGDVGTYNPELRSVIAYNTDSKITPTTRTNGILLAQVCPKGGIISGTSSVMELDGWNWEDAVYKMDDGVHLNWISMNNQSFNEDGEPGKSDKNSNYQKQKNELIKFFEDSKAYAQSTPIEKDLRFEAMRGIFDGSKTLYIHVSYVKEIIDAVSFYKTSSVKKMVLVQARDAWMVTDLLKENNIPVVLMATHELPARAEDDVDLPYKMPYLLQKGGVLFCLSNSDGSEPMQMRNLPFLAGTAAAYGLTKEEALQSITFNAAKILGIDNRTGTLENGKDATFFVSTGDALDMKTNNLEIAFIRGKKLDLNNEQKELYERYKGKYNLK